MKRTIAGVMNWGVWGANLSIDQMSNLIQQCIDGGVTTFDHADIYGGYTTEKSWGDAWKNMSINRDDVEIISKCGICIPCEERPQYKIKHYDHSAQHIIDSVKRSIENLQCEYLDEILIHRPAPLMDPEEIIRAIQALRQEGLIRRCGVSNFTQAQIMLLSKVDISTNQVEISMLNMDALHDGIIDYCFTYGVEIQAWSPLGGGALFQKSSDPNLVMQRDRLNKVGLKYGWGLDTMSYLFLLHHPAGIRPVVGSSKWERIKTSVEAEEIKISDEQWYEIWTAAVGHEVP